MMACDLASSPDGYVHMIFSLVLGLAPLRSHTGNPSHVRGRERSASAVDAVGPIVTIAYVGLRCPTFPRRLARARSQKSPG